MECLERECYEETEFLVETQKNLGCFDFLITDYLKKETIHHIAQFYTVSIIEDDKERLRAISKNSITFLADDNDSKGCVFVPISSLNVKNSSPLIIRAIQLINGNHDSKIVHWRKNE